jgi:hypothetical protein
MSCCGKQREAMRKLPATKVQRVEGRPAVGSTAQAEQSAVVFMGSGAYLAASPHTGRVYHFFAGRTQLVDTVDLPSLLRTGLFEAGTLAISAEPPSQA